MRTNIFLIALAMAEFFSMVPTGFVSAMPLQSRGEISRAESGVWTAASDPAVNIIIDRAAIDVLVGKVPLSTLNTDRPLPAILLPDLPSGARPATHNPAARYFGGIPGDTFERASTAPNRGSPPNAPRRQQDDIGGEQQITLKDLVRALINRPENLALNATVAGPARGARPAPRQGDSILSTILAIAIDKEMVEAISKVLRPSIGATGIVAVNLFGMGNIALLVAPGSNSIRLIDLGSGRSMSLKIRNTADMLGNQNPVSLTQPGVPQAMSDRKNLLPSIIAAVHRWLSMYVFNGFTLIVLSLLTIFWFFWGLVRRAR